MRKSSIFFGVAFAVLATGPSLAEPFAPTTVNVLDGTTLTYRGSVFSKSSQPETFTLGADVYLPPFPTNETDPSGGKLICLALASKAYDLSYENFEAEFDAYWQKHDSFGRRDTTNFSKLDGIKAKVAETTGLVYVLGNYNSYRRTIVWVSHGVTYKADVGCRAKLTVPNIRDQAIARFSMVISADVDDSLYLIW